MIILDLETVSGIPITQAIELWGSSRRRDQEGSRSEDVVAEAKKFASLTPSLCQIAVAGLRGPNNQKAYVNMQAFGGAKGEPDGDILPMAGESSLVERVFSVIGVQKHWPLVTFNGRRFDLPVLFAAALRHSIPIPPAVWGLMSEYRYAKQPTHVDMLDVLTNYGACSGGLRAWCVGLGLGDPKDGCDGSQIGELVEAGCVAPAAKYCLGDCEYTAALFERWQITTKWFLTARP